ncbi:hypothetical protein M5D96_006239 [Drosophila gunungcola]|uniref:Uncharacterized protein n=1 Tax=Drosophila gunungcola TaxID=103775 RepID=A0A9P9YNM4_9MUSC|nr:hypothetical protein M5D96_006239 [Drosophila gunungcola]
MEYTERKIKNQVIFAECRDKVPKTLEKRSGDK